MRTYMRRHEQWLSQLLTVDQGDTNWEKVAHYHDKQIRFMQHERLIHLLVTLAFALFFLLSIGLFLFEPGVTTAIFCVLLLGLLIPYIIHYYVLENGVQRWYCLANDIEHRKSKILDTANG